MNSTAYSSGRQTFVMIAPNPRSVVIESLCLILMVQFRTYWYVLFSHLQHNNAMLMS